LRGPFFASEDGYPARQVTGTVNEERAAHTSVELLGTSSQAERESAERAASQRRAE